MAARLGGGLLLVAVICVAAACVPTGCAQPPPPTKAQLRAELQSMAKSIVKRYPQYSRYAQDATKYINLAHPFTAFSFSPLSPPLPSHAVNSKYDLSALRDASILIPNNVQAEALAKRIPAKSSSIPTLYNITAFHILRRRMTLPQMRQVKLRTAIGTQLRQPLFKMTPMGNNSAVSFAEGPYLKADQWTTFRIPGLYLSRWFIAHGVDRVIIPTYTKV
ncbi:unnamed protein product [Closterium sp. Naga37s-1]|nr:unnamed protein product [Closterium sp. Naga37s-1]CAI5527318.1 unnamed protein product [Closterium sp. Naga37s-1]